MESGTLANIAETATADKTNKSYIGFPNRFGFKPSSNAI